MEEAKNRRTHANAAKVSSNPQFLTTKARQKNRKPTMMEEITIMEMQRCSRYRPRLIFYTTMPDSRVLHGRGDRVKVSCVVHSDKDPPKSRSDGCMCLETFDLRHDLEWGSRPYSSYGRARPSRQSPLLSTAPTRFPLLHQPVILRQLHTSCIREVLMTR